MLKHLFKLIWNKKKQNALLIIEMIFSFLVLFAVFSFLVYYYNNYRQPAGFEYEKTLAVSYDMDTGENANKDSLEQVFLHLKQAVQSLPEIKGMSYSSNNFPFAMSTSMSNSSHNGKAVMTNHYSTDDDYARVMGLTILEGRWFSNEDNAPTNPSVVINDKAREAYFGKEKAVGKTIKIGDTEKKIVGVVQTLKDKGDYKPLLPGTYTRINHSNRAMISVKPGADPAFEGRLYKVFTHHLSKATIEIEHLNKKRISMNRQTLIPMILMLVVGGFLVINVALGLYGVLWYNVSRRRSEIGLRRAIGATGNGITGQIVSETLVLSTLALLAGCFFAIQFPLLNLFDMASGIYITAIIISILFIYLLVIICSLYPGRQAANILPAVALHED